MWEFLTLSHVCGIPIHTDVIKLGYFLPLICLMLIYLDKPEEPRSVEENFFFPHKTKLDMS